MMVTNPQATMTPEELAAMHRDGKQVPRTELIKHNRETRKAAGLTHKCPKCQRQFTSTSGIERHLNEYHKL